MADSMLCTYCGHTKQYPDGFPQRHFAQCWECAWDDHIHTSHPRIVRRIRRVAKKRAKVTSTRQAFDTLFEREKRQVLGVSEISTSPAGGEG